MKLLMTEKCAYLVDVFVPENNLNHNFLKVLLKNTLFKTFFYLLLYFYVISYILFSKTKILLLISVFT